MPLLTVENTFANQIQQCLPHSVPAQPKFFAEIKFRWDLRSWIPYMIMNTLTYTGFKLVIERQNSVLVYVRFLRTQCTNLLTTSIVQTFTFYSRARRGHRIQRGFGIRPTPYKHLCSILQRIKRYEILPRS